MSAHGVRFAPEVRDEKIQQAAELVRAGKSKEEIAEILDVAIPTARNFIGLAHYRGYLP